MGQGRVSIGKSNDTSRFQSRALFAGLEQSEGAPKLWFAVLAQAFRDYYGDIPSEGPSCYRKVQVHYCQRIARAWFLSDSPSMGSFRWIADLFELNPQAVRKRLFSGTRIDLTENVERESVAQPILADDATVAHAAVDEVVMDEPSSSSIEVDALSAPASLDAMVVSEAPASFAVSEELARAAIIRFPASAMIPA